MTPEGRTYVLMRLSEAPNIKALRTVWESVSNEYQRDPEIQAHKDRMKESLKG